MAMPSARRWKINMQGTALPPEVQESWAESHEGTRKAHSHSYRPLDLNLARCCRLRPHYLAGSKYHLRLFCDSVALGVGYGIPSIRVDGNDLLAVYQATKEARCVPLRLCSPPPPTHAYICAPAATLMTCPPPNMTRTGKFALKSSGQCCSK